MFRNTVWQSFMTSEYDSYAMFGTFTNYLDQSNCFDAYILLTYNTIQYGTSSRAGLTGLWNWINTMLVLADRSLRAYIIMLELLNETVFIILSHMVDFLVGPKKKAKCSQWNITKQTIWISMKTISAHTKKTGLAPWFFKLHLDYPFNRKLSTFLRYFLPSGKEGTMTGVSIHSAFSPV